MSMSTLHEIVLESANKQPGMVDSLTEDAPILKLVKWQPSTHGLHNVAEELTNVEGPGFTEADGPLPLMGADSRLIQTDLFHMGGTMEVPTLRAVKFGGPEKYFARKQDALLRKSGMDCEKQLMEQNWLKGAKAAKNLRDAKGTGKGWYILAVRFDPLANVGLYDPDQFEQGRMFKISLPYGGQEHYLRGARYQGVLGYSVTYRAIFGWQLIDPKRTCAAIVNIEPGKNPTADMIDDMLADVRAQAGSTYLFMSPRARVHGINPHKHEHVMLTNADKDMNTMLESWGGIPIILSHNFNEPVPHINVA